MFTDENRHVVYEDLEIEPNPFETQLRIIHFNDVYNIEEHTGEPVGGASRFVTALNRLQEEQPSLVVFSGDALSPSSISVFSKGKQMIEALNKCGIHAAAIGNHEFDMGLEELENRIKESEFTWLLSNVFDAATDEPLLNLESRKIVEINGIKVGFFALAEKDWVSSLSCIDFDELIYEPYVDLSRKIAKELREEQGADFVIAITHMRWRNDEKLAKKVPEIDLVLGGHDHEYGVKKVNDTWIIKSGSDFQEMSVIEVDISDSYKLKKIEKIIINSEIPENLEMKQIVETHLGPISTQDIKREFQLLEKELGHINCELDGRYTHVRTHETNLGNFLCDIIMSAVEADCAILNGGSLRSDRIHPSGPFTLKDLRDILSFESELVVLEVTGKQVHELLENCLSKYEDIGGRFPQVSGLFFTYEPSRPPWDRVDEKLVKIQNQHLISDKVYTLATNTFMSKVDSVLKTCPVKIPHENIPQLHILIENYFKTINDIKSNKLNFRYQCSIVSRRDRNHLLKNLINHVLESQPKVEISPLSFHTVSLFISKARKIRKNILLRKDVRLVKQSPEYKQGMKQYQQKSLDLDPHIENRSVLIGSVDEKLTGFVSS